MKNISNEEMHNIEDALEILVEEFGFTSQKQTYHNKFIIEIEPYSIKNVFDGKVDLEKLDQTLNNLISVCFIVSKDYIHNNFLGIKIFPMSFIPIDTGFEAHQITNEGKLILDETLHTS